MSNKAEVIRSICHIPTDFRKGDVSFERLLKRSGYPDIGDAISVEDIANYLKSNPSLMAFWIQWSEDKRCDGPYIRKAGASFEVGKITSAGTFSNVRMFDDSVEACSNFIVEELRAR